MLTAFPIFSSRTARPMERVISGFLLTANELSSMIVPDVEQDFLILAIQRELVDIAQKGLHVV